MHDHAVAEHAVFPHDRVGLDLAIRAKLRAGFEATAA
jgi:hypothetical protein